METFKLDNYLVFAKEIGRGSFSTVYKGINQNNNQEVAIKKINNKALSKMRNYIDKEINLMKKLNHKNIVKLYDVLYDFNNTEEVYLILEYCCNGDLTKFLDSNGIDEKLAKNYLKQLSEGLKYLKDNNISHRDLKPQNILIDKDNVLKIIDFGFAKNIDPSNMADTFCGSPLYMAPEILTYNKYTDQADLWSVGVILYELLTGKTPFYAQNIYDLVNKIKNNEVVIPNYINLSSECKHILFSLLQKNPKNRISWNEFYYHPWFKDYEEIDKLYENIFKSRLNLKGGKEYDTIYSENSIEDDLIFEFEEDLKEMKKSSKSDIDDEFVIISDSLPIDINRKSFLNNVFSSIGNLGSSLYQYAKSI
jgi:serine/threonine-protein kinase ULK/ATG1